MTAHDPDRRVYIVEFVRDFTAEHGYPPSFRQIAEATGLRSLSAVAFHVGALVDQGVLLRDPGTARSVRVAR